MYSESSNFVHRASYIYFICVSVNPLGAWSRRLYKGLPDKRLIATESLRDTSLHVISKLFFAIVAPHDLLRDYVPCNPSTDTELIFAGCRCRYHFVGSSREREAYYLKGLLRTHFTLPISNIMELILYQIRSSRLHILGVGSGTTPYKGILFLKTK
jgi:hypothetical protein